MKFTANGSTIPDRLLRQQEHGNVVFLCGSGVSFDSGMPNFDDLATLILKELDPSGTSDISKLFRKRQLTKSKVREPTIQLDHIFERLGMVYGQDVVNSVVAKVLKTPSCPVDVSHHKAILKISSDQYNFPQVVTTNFDLLFEKAHKELNEFQKISVFEPKNFPNIREGGAVQGITYIHGRLKDEESEDHSYVLSQREFAEAYLLNDYLTKFLHDLISNYTVVFLGYSANDTLVNYLLRGLGSSVRAGKSELFAFELKSDSVAKKKWREFNANVIEFKDFPNLWDTLNNWAEKSEDIEKWNKSVCKLAIKSPTKLPSYKRGMVNYLVQGEEGARLFSRSIPIPSADWVCVFDLMCRTKPVFLKSNFDTKLRLFRKQYRLDSDLNLGDIESENVITGRYDNALGWTKNDDCTTSLPLLFGYKREGYNGLPNRLFHLSQWIVNSLHNPVIAWWAIQQDGLHPQLIRDIRSKLRITRRDLPEVATLIWTYILEFQSNYETDDSMLFMFQPVGLNFRDNWDSIVFRELEKVLSPIPKPTLPLDGNKNNPPEVDWENLTLNDFCNWKLVFSNYYLRFLTVPNSAKVRVFETLVRVFHKISDYLNDIGPIKLKIPALYREKSDERREFGSYGFEDYEYECVEFYYFFRELFIEVLNINPNRLKNIVSVWSEKEGHFFRKFKLFALNQEMLFTANEAAQILLKFDQESFWDFSNRRELLFLISRRWNSFSASVRTKLVNRLLAGPDENFITTNDKNPESGKKVAAQYLYWLTTQYCQLNRIQAGKLEELIQNVSEWNFEEASNIVAELKPDRGTVNDYSTDRLVDLPVESIIQEAQKISEGESNDSVSYKPFIGLVRTDPEKALIALSLCNECNDFIFECWEALISPLSEYITDSLILEIAVCVIQLPKETVQRLRFCIGHLIKYCFEIIYDKDEALLWNLVDYYFRCLSSGDPILTESSIVHNPYIEDSKSIHIFHHALEGPVGYIVMGILELITDSKFKNYQEVFEEFKIRLPEYLEVSGDGKSHVIVLLGWYIDKLHQRDPVWVEKEILPWMNTKHEYARFMWSGFLERTEIPHKELRRKIKPYFSNLFLFLKSANSSKWAKREESAAANIMLWMTIFSKDQEGRITQIEAHKYLKQLSQRGRNYIISLLCKIGRDIDRGWERLVIPFIQKSWPVEKNYRVKSSVSAWVELLGETNDDFPIVFPSVRQFLIPINIQSLEFDCFLSKDKVSYPLAEKFPDLFLEFLQTVVSESSSHGDYHLVQILKKIESVKNELSYDRKFKRLMKVAKRDQS